MTTLLPALPTNAEPLMAAEITFGSDVIGRVVGVVHDPISGRVRYVITAYGPNRRQVAVPMEWVRHQAPHRLALGVGAHSLDDLPDAVHALRMGVG